MKYPGSRWAGHLTRSRQRSAAALGTRCPFAFAAKVRSHRQLKSLPPFDAPLFGERFRSFGLCV